MTKKLRKIKEPISDNPASKAPVVSPEITTKKHISTKKNIVNQSYSPY